MTDIDPFEIQGFIDGYGDGRAAWSTGVCGVPAVLAYLSKTLPDTEAAAVLVRRAEPSGPDGEEIGPYRLVHADARERLARHLYTVALGRHLRRAGEVEWDEQKTNPRDVEHCYAQADEYLAVIAGTETTS
jgi:hypothetical protein